MCCLYMGRMLDWKRLHKSFSDEFCDPTTICTRRMAEAPGLVDHLAKFYSTC